MSRPRKKQPLFSSGSRESTRLPRMLRRVTQTVAQTHELAPGYKVTWWNQTLECAHTVVAYTTEQRDAKRRQCPACAAILQQACTAPAPKRPVGTARKNGSIRVA